MAKNKGIIQFQGKLGDKVFTRHKTAGEVVRNAVKPGTKRNEIPLQTQYKRTAYLNMLASQINNVLLQNECRLKEAAFYQNVQSRFRSADQDNRLHLLKTLVGLEVHRRYKLEKAGAPEIKVTQDKKKLIVELLVQYGPQTKYKADCYFFEVWLLTWGAGDRAPAVSRDYTEWFNPEDGRPEFEIVFSITPSTVHWLLGVRIQFGVNNKEILSFGAQGMQWMEAGTLNKKEAAHYQRLQDEKAKRKKEEELKRWQNKKPEPKRVKARRVNPK